MSQENVEIVREWLGSVRDSEDFAWHLLAPDAELINATGAPLPTRLGMKVFAHGARTSAGSPAMWSRQLMTLTSTQCCARSPGSSGRRGGPSRSGVCLRRRSGSWSSATGARPRRTAVVPYLGSAGAIPGRLCRLCPELSPPKKPPGLGRFAPGVRRSSVASPRWSYDETWTNPTRALGSIRSPFVRQSDTETTGNNRT